MRGARVHKWQAAEILYNLEDLAGSFRERMFDLYLGLIALSLISLIGFAISVRLPLRSSKRRGLLFMVVVLLAMALYAIFVRDSVLLAWCLPYSNLIVVGNWFPIGMAVLAGLAWRHASGPRWRRA